MADIFREVDEEVRKDRATELWKKYGIYVVLACLVLVLGTAGRVAWQHYDSERRLEEAARFVTASRLAENGDRDAAISSLAALSEEASTGYALVARFREATERAAAGDTQGAVRLYDRLAADDDVEAMYRELAALQAASLLFDSAGAEDLRGRLSPLAEDNKPWRYSARELLALLKYRSGERDAAKTAFSELAEDANAPSGIRLRAQEMLAAMGVEG